jgi:hypothetical protein
MPGAGGIWLFPWVPDGTINLETTIFALIVVSLALASHQRPIAFTIVSL